MFMTVSEARKVRLAEGTDAGEFIAQNLSHLMDRDLERAAFEAIAVEDPKPEDLAKVLGQQEPLANGGPYTRVLNGLGEYGMEFESMQRRGDMSLKEQRLAEEGIRSAEEFIRAALLIGREE